MGDRERLRFMFSVASYLDKHSETGHNGKKVKHSYVLEGQSHSHQSDCEPRNIFLRDV